jgi:hypothetical protein
LQVTRMLSVGIRTRIRTEFSSGSVKEKLLGSPQDEDSFLAYH